MLDPAPTITGIQGTKTVAYLANQFPSAMEPYVWEEICQLCSRGVGVVATSIRRPNDAELTPDLREIAKQTLFLQPMRWWLLLRAAWLCLCSLGILSDILLRVLVRGNERPGRRIRALLHTWLGAYYALLLQKRGVEHIQAHHGYFGSWVAMVAARLLGITFSMTLHGSDLLRHGAYLDIKLANCSFCFTVSEYNRRFILEHYSDIPHEKITVQHMGVDTPLPLIAASQAQGPEGCLLLLAVGRLHQVKDHAFLVRACVLLRQRNVRFLCLIAGEGPERNSLVNLIAGLGLTSQVKLLGHLAKDELDLYYRMADLVVLTSLSEGIPLVLMEAMARGKTVLAPAITGIPELVIDGETGFLFQPGSLDEFVSRVELIEALSPQLATVGLAAREYVLSYFNRQTNLEIFANRFLARLYPSAESVTNENPVLQQI